MPQAGLHMAVLSLLASLPIAGCEQTLARLNDGKLPEIAANIIEHMWKTIKYEAPLVKYYV